MAPLSVHMKTVHGTERIPCSQEGCTVSFKRMTDMRKHVRTVHCEKKLCPICGERFKKINEHVKIKHQSEKLHCKQCDKVYYTESGLQYHLKVVHQHAKKVGEYCWGLLLKLLPVQTICHICAREFRDLKSHLVYQHGGGKEEKKLPCRVADCGRMFRNSQVENIHYKSTHLNLKEECGVCGGWFKNLSAHINQIHNSVNKFPCEQCGKSFTKKCDLRLHVDRVHLQKRYRSDDIFCN